jgi:hypothetical protein
MTRAALLLTAAVAAAAAPAGASAATWAQPLRACYVSSGPAPGARQLAHVRAQGFAPGAAVDVLVDGAAAAAVAADGAGRVAADVPVPYQPAGQRAFALTVAQRGDPAGALTAAPLVTALALELDPATAPPSRRVRFSGRGFTRRAPVWGHYLFGGALRRTVRLAARPAGACGTFSAHRRQIPLVRPRTGRWTLQVDQQKAYALAPASVFVRLDIDVRRIMGNP